jgi:hypothetical protein
MITTSRKCIRYLPQPDAELEADDAEPEADNVEPEANDAVDDVDPVQIEY